MRWMFMIFFLAVKAHSAELPYWHFRSEPFEVHREKWDKLRPGEWRIIKLSSIAFIYDTREGAFVCIDKRHVHPDQLEFSKFDIDDGIRVLDWAQLQRIFDLNFQKSRDEAIGVKAYVLRRGEEQEKQLLQALKRAIAKPDDLDSEIIDPLRQVKFSEYLGDFVIYQGEYKPPGSPSDQRYDPPKSRSELERAYVRWFVGLAITFGYTAGTVIPMVFLPMVVGSTTQGQFVEIDGYMIYKWPHDYIRNVWGAGILSSMVWTPISSWAWARYWVKRKSTSELERFWRVKKYSEEAISSGFDDTTVEDFRNKKEAVIRSILLGPVAATSVIVCAHFLKMLVDR